MTENEIEIDDIVYAVKKFGTIKSGFDIQIIKYRVQYKGTCAFIPYGFHNLDERCQEIEYDECCKTLDEAKEIVKIILGDSVDFIERYHGAYYDVETRD